MKSEIKFADEKIKVAFDKLKNSKTEDKMDHKEYERKFKYT